MNPNGNPQNLKPVKAGDPPLNPTGINQYTYRAEAEKHLAEWCRAHGQELIDRLCDDARDGKTKMMELVLARVLPVVKEISLSVNDEREPVVVPSTNDRMGAVSELLAGTLH